MSRHTLSVLLENKPGALTRLTGLIARRGFNIDSLAVGTTEVEEISRLTMVVDVEDVPLEQVTKQLNKLVNVIKVVELEPANSVERGHVIFKVAADSVTRGQIADACELFRVRIIDVVPDAVCVEATGEESKLEALRAVLEPFGIREIVQSGLLAISRGSRSISDRSTWA